MKQMETMKAHGIRPSSASYCCALACCEANEDVDTAFRLYHEACDTGLLLTDDVHNCLIRVCTVCGRVDDALTEIKALMRKHGKMQQDTINSLTRALCDSYIGVTLRHAW
jgi:pentatricopeptide repeat protein